MTHPSPRCSLHVVGALLLAGATILVAAPARAEAPPNVDAETKSAARVLTENGLTLFDAGKYSEAVDKLSRADDLVRLPTTGLALARAYLKVGKLVEASEKLFSVTRISLDASAAPAQRKAQETAEKERKELAPRIPTLELSLEPDDPAATVTVDGKPLVRALLGVRRPTNPGARLIEVTSSGGVVRRQVTLAERAAERVVVKPAPPAPVANAEATPAAVTPPPDAASPPPPAASTVASTAPHAGVTAAPMAAPTAASPDAPRTSPLAITGGVLLGVGGAGLAAAGALGLFTMSTVNDLEVCSADPACTRDDQVSLRDRASGQQTGAFVALGIGAAIAATGGVLLVLAPSSKAPSTAATALVVGPTGVGLKLRF